MRPLGVAEATLVSDVLAVLGGQALDPKACTPAGTAALAGLLGDLGEQLRASGDRTIGLEGLLHRALRLHQQAQPARPARRVVAR